MGGGTEVAVGVKLEVAGAGEEEEEGGKVACTVYWRVTSPRLPLNWFGQTDGHWAAPPQHIPRCFRTRWMTSNQI